MCDTDDDNDGVLDVNDNCPLIANSNQLDTDKDGQGNVCDTDDDNDGVADAKDNCPLISNSNQLDTDKDGQGDACDGDDDNDSVPDAYDCAPLDKKNNKWLVCHGGQTLCVDKKGMQDHVKHGDKLGRCGTSIVASRTLLRAVQLPHFRKRLSFPTLRLVFIQIQTMAGSLCR